MTQKALIINESAYFKAGDIVEGKVENDKLIIDEHVVEQSNFILLEKLSRQDEEQVRKIVQDILKRMLWRLYTRSAFLTK